MQWYLRVLRQYCVLSGRASRREYWMFMLVNVIVAVVLGGIQYLLKMDNSLLTVIYNLAVALPALGVTVRRLHDSNRSGYWCFIALIPFIGTLVLLYFMILESDKGANRFGDVPASV